MAMDTQSLGKQHPYDPAYGLMKTMQGELNELRAALHAEQQQRTREVAELRREVIDLQSRLSQQYAEQSMQHQTVSCALTNETALRGKSIEKLRNEVATAIARAEEVDGLKTLQATQFGKLATELKTQKRERVDNVKDLDVRLHAEMAERREQCERIIEDLTNHKAVTAANLSLDREKLDYLTHNVQLAGELLTTGSLESFHEGAKAFSSVFSPGSTATPSALGSTHQSLGDSRPSTRPYSQTQRGTLHAELN